MIVCWITETRVRDFEPRLLAACQLTELGFTSLVGRRESIKRWALRSGIPLVWIDKSIGGLLPAEEEEITSAGGFGICLDEEGGIYPEQGYDEAIAARFLSAYFSPRQRYWAWGERQASSMMKLGFISAGKVAVVGNPRFDHCKEEMAGFHMALDPELSDLRPYILINTKFTPSNSNMLKGKVLPGWQSEKVAQCHRDLASYLTLIDNLSDRVPDLNILIRPHPVEIAATYRDKFAGHRNVFIDNGKRPIARSSCLAEAVIHMDCTTAIEALLAGHPPISYLPSGVPIRAQTLPIEISDVAYSEEEAFALIDRRRGGEEADARRERALDQCEPVIANVRGVFFDRVRSAFEVIGSRSGFRRDEIEPLGRDDQRRIAKVWAKQKLLRLVGKKLMKEPKFPPHTPGEIEAISRCGIEHGVIPESARCRWLSGELVLVEPVSAT
jgi:surface carbohydrate biosynthesis protein